MNVQKLSDFDIFPRCPTADYKLDGANWTPWNVMVEIDDPTQRRALLNLCPGAKLAKLCLTDRP